MFWGIFSSLIFGYLPSNCYQNDEPWPALTKYYYSIFFNNGKYFPKVMLQLFYFFVELTLSNYYLTSNNIHLFFLNYLS